jgi:olefin beta-lactone synthetase
MTNLQVELSAAPLRVNVADLLTAAAERSPEQVAVAVAHPRGRVDAYRTICFAELDSEAAQLARGLAEVGVGPGSRMVLLVPCGIEFVALVFALLKTGATMVLIDPGMGRKHLLDCLAAVEPDGFIGVPRAQALRAVLRSRFPRACLNVTVGRRWFWRGETLASLRRRGDFARSSLPETGGDDPAAIVFTSGSTGSPKGVLYHHETFATQVREIRDFYGIEAGGVDLACFPLFGLFNAAMGTTTVFPEMDFSRPAACDPRKVVQAARDWNVTQAFASPAVWDRVSRYCADASVRLESLSRVFSCGAPVSAKVLRATLECVAEGAEMHTPYGATEALPVSSIEAAEVLGESAAKTATGAGVCVGRKFPSVEWKVIRIRDEAIPTLDDAEELPAGEIGEVIVRGAQVSREYVTRTDWNALSKIRDGDTVWHRMGDAGYLDEDGRLWYCGRVGHRVETKNGVLFSVPIEEIFNAHPDVHRTALVGVGERGAEKPVLIVEPAASSNGAPHSGQMQSNLIPQLRGIAKRHDATRSIDEFRVRSALPTDVRHNAKIAREELKAVLQSEGGIVRVGRDGDYGRLNANSNE